ncbi:MAG: hypothetical protein HKN20_14215 [Gemmatimonadetes bacterium]|nr:hypothetical protein [Gemmatimonadota bacterium]
MTLRLFRTPVVLAAAMASLLSFSFGCYTVVRHPQSMQVTQRVDESGHTNGGGACNDCHFESEWLGYFDHPLIYGFGGYATHERWYDFYDRPWWYDNYWDHDDGQGGTPGSPFPEGAASSWTRRPRVRGEAPVIDPGVPPSTQSGSTGASSTTPAYSTPSTQPSSGSGEARENEPASSYDKKKRTPR